MKELKVLCFVVDLNSELISILVGHVAAHPSKYICEYFPKREELSLRTVLAFPKDSNRGVASRI